MKYRALQTFATLTAAYYEGEEYELEAKVAKEYVAIGFLEELKTSTPKKATPFRSGAKAETSVEADVEKASDL